MYFIQLHLFEKRNLLKRAYLIYLKGFFGTNSIRQLLARIKIKINQNQEKE